MMKTEYTKECGFLQRDNVEHEGYAEVYSTECQEVEERNGADLLEKVLERENLNRAYKRVKANKGASGIDGMSVEEALPWLKEHREELLESIRLGKYKPSPVRRVEIPKDNGGVRKLGIPTVIDRIIQQAISQVLTPIYEPKFSDGSYGYRPHRSAKDAVCKIKEYAEQGYCNAVCLDLSKYFDTLNHELLMNMLREDIKDKRLIDLIKKYLKSGVMENGIVMKTEEGSPQGGNLSPLLANVYLDKFDKEFERRGVKVIRYADDIILLAKSKRASERLLETSSRYLEKKLKLRVNKEKSRAVSVYDTKGNFVFSVLRWGRMERVYLSEFTQNREAERKLRKLTSRSQGRKLDTVLNNVKVFMRGWLGYYAIADMGEYLKDLNGWLRRRIRMYIWKQWKLPRTRVENLKKLGMADWKAYRNGNTRKGYWAVAGSGILSTTITNKRLERRGYYDISKAYKSLHSI